MSVSFPLTDAGNADRLVALCGSKFRYVPKWGRFMVWQGSHWADDHGNCRIGALTRVVVDAIGRELAEGRDKPPEEQNEAHIKELSKAWANAQSARSYDAMIKLVKANPEVAAEPEDFDCKPWLLNIANGTLNLKTGELQKANPNDMLTNAAPVKYVQGAECPTWRKFLDTSLPNKEVQAFLQRYVGYCLTGMTNERLMVICLGVGRNGKSVMIRALSELLGPYARTADPELLIAKGQDVHPTGLADLFGRRLVTTSELRKGRAWDEEKLKRLTGNDKVTARRMREDPWEFKPTFKLLIAANDEPRVFDSGDGFWDRIAVIPFEVRIPEDQVDKHLLEKLQKELPGILNWALEGCRDWQESGLRPPEAVRAASAEYREDEDVMGDFIASELKLEANATMTSAELGERIRKWCETNNLRAFSVKSVVTRLKNMGVQRFRTMTYRGLEGVRAKTREERAATVIKPN